MVNYNIDAASSGFDQFKRRSTNREVDPVSRSRINKSPLDDKTSSGFDQFNRRKTNQGLGSPTNQTNMKDDDDDKDVGGIGRLFAKFFGAAEENGLEFTKPDRKLKPSIYDRDDMKPIDIDAQMKRIENAVNYDLAEPFTFKDDEYAASTYDEVMDQDIPQKSMVDVINTAIENTIPTGGYKVQKGDTLSEIAQATGRTVKELQQLNNITNPRKMQAGSTLKIPVQTAQDLEVVESATKMSDLKPIKFSNQSMMTGDQRIYEPETGFGGMGPDPSTGKGIMSLPGGYDEGPLKELGLMTSQRLEPTDAITAATQEKTNFVNTFVNRMGTDEGTEDHVDSLGITTLGYGVLPQTARTLGYDPDSEEYQDREKLAKVVYNDMYDNARAAYPKIFNNITMTQAQGVLSMYINLGEIPNSVVRALSRDEPDFDAAKEGLAINILGSPRDTNGSRRVVDGKVVYTSSKGLSKRRAKEYNTLMEGDPDYKPITDVEVRGSRARPTFVWVAEDGTVVHSYTPQINNDEITYQGLDSSNTMRSVSVD